ncbi:hypothetical protein ACFP63_08790 [Oerskovia jenensis]|uniref:Phage gp6-like head-tail connector protein n=1 Tax=Oerskovia jenensis TaxID=162169 RepID=A0ABS2LJT9_9CELL|nr:hypothetical protein [Oerskovia jenensis]MBM7480149.1 hypothetical protein [Oerskovia jenensis]
MTSPDPYLDANRLYVLSNAVPAIAAHLGLTLDTDGAPIAPTPGPLVDAVAAHIYARHTENRYTTWDDLSPAGRAPWIATAQGVIQLSTAANETVEAGA